MRRRRNRTKGYKLRGKKLARFRRRIRAAWRKRGGVSRRRRKTTKSKSSYRLGAVKSRATRRRASIRSSAQAALCGLVGLPHDKLGKRIAGLKRMCVTPGLRAGVHGPVQHKPAKKGFLSGILGKGGYSPIGSISLNRRRRYNYSTWIPDFGYNPYWVPSYAQNPGLTSAFSSDVLSSALPVLGGVVGNAILTRKIGDILPFAREGVGSYVVGLASAGLLGAGLSTFSPKLGSGVFFGGIIEVVTKILKNVTGGLSGMSDYNPGNMGYWISQGDAVSSELTPFEYAAPISHDVVENVVAGEMA